MRIQEKKSLHRRTENKKKKYHLVTDNHQGDYTDLMGPIIYNMPCLWFSSHTFD